MSNFPVIRFRALDNNGNVLPGAKLTFYAAGPTTTLQPTYTTADLDTQNSNPVLADGNGYFPEIYLDPELGYYVEFHTAADVLIWTANRIFGTALGSSNLITRIQVSGVSPNDFGAIGNGASDETEATQEAIDAASPVVNLGGLTYRCDYTLTLRSELQIINGTLDFSSSGDDRYLKAWGTASEGTTLGDDVAIGDTSIIANPAGLGVGSLVRVESSSPWRGSSMGAGELAIISGFGAEAINLSSPARGAYGSELTLLKKITPVHDVVFRGVTIVGSSDSVGEGVLASLRYCRHVVFEDCHFVGFKSSAALIEASLDVQFVRCTFADGGTGSKAIVANECCELLGVEQCQFERLEQAIDLGEDGTRDGVCRAITIRGNSIVGCTVKAIGAHELVEGLVLEGNTIDHGDAIGIELEGASDVSMLGNIVRVSGAQALSATGKAQGVRMEGNRFLRLDQAGACVQFAGTSADDIDDVTAVNNYFGGGTYGILGNNVKNGSFGRFANFFEDQATGQTSGIGTNVAIDVGAITSTDIVTSPAANKVPRAGSNSKIDAGWLPDISGTYAPASQGVTNGNSHDHNGGDGAQIAHGNLSSAGSNTHAQIDTHIASVDNPHGVTAAQAGAIATGAAGAALGVATLNGSSLVVQEPASKSQANGIASLNSSGQVVQNLAGFCAGRIDSDGTTLWARGASFTSSQSSTGVYSISVAGITASASVLVTPYSTDFAVNASPGTGAFGVGTRYGGSPANSGFFFMALW